MLIDTESQEFVVLLSKARYGGMIHVCEQVRDGIIRKVRPEKHIDRQIMLDVLGKKIYDCEYWIKSN